MGLPPSTSGSSTPPAELRLVADLVEVRIASLLAAESARWTALDPNLAELVDVLARFVLSGGKRLRPTFCHWGFVASGGDPDEPAVVDAGAALELLQAFALVHDDVMDGSALRRGAPTVHRTFAAKHEDTGWRNEARRFGEGVAILLGDLAHVYADRLLPAGPPEVAEVWDELRIELNVGQYLDLLATAQGDTARTTARRIARYKSGKYTIERPLHLGAALAGRYREMGPVLSAYGDPLGEAFQLRDDLLGVFGDEDRTGKPVGDDLREGKPTLLLAIADERWPRSQRELRHRVGAPDLGRDEVAALQALFVATGARDEVDVAIEALAEQAITAITAADVAERACEALVSLAHFVAERDS
ncbi:MAG: geranylgeranyl pyrophosphate synthase [Acidimicrobiales bacterium]|nr:geranylgeranyl pyrophosphate synthase [Acidimicrobiales bacterium]